MNRHGLTATAMDPPTLIRWRVMNIACRLLALILCVVLLPAPPARADEPLEEVLVTGQQPGPGLW